MLEALLISEEAVKAESASVSRRFELHPSVGAVRKETKRASID